MAITKLAVHCVDLDERKRPTMTQIVNYLQGIIDEWDTQSTEETAGKKKTVMQRMKGNLFCHCLITKTN